MLRPDLKPAASSPASPSYQRAPVRAGKPRSLRMRVLRAPDSASSSPSQATIGRVRLVPCGVEPARGDLEHIAAVPLPPLHPVPQQRLLQVAHLVTLAAA